MASLGTFGAAKQAADPDRERDTFTFCGVDFTVADDIDPLAILEFGEAAASGMDDQDPAALGAILSLIRSSVDEADWPKFRKTVRTHRPPIADLMNMAMAVVQRESGRPTGQPSDSSGGSLTITGSLRESSSSEESLSPIQRDPRVRSLVPVSEAGRVLARAV